MINNKLTQQIPIGKRIRQEDSLSPNLFNLIDELKEVGQRYKTDKGDIKIICYAYDTVLIVKNEDILQRLLPTFHQNAIN